MLNKDKHKWKLTKSVMYSMYVSSRAMSLLDLTTDLILLYKASRPASNGEFNRGSLILTITLFISIFSPYVLSYSSGIKLFIFRKTFDNLKGFKKLFLLLYLLPSGFLYFILVDIIDCLFTVHKWCLYNCLCRSEESILETEELLAQQLGMDRMSM